MNKFIIKINMQIKFQKIQEKKYKLIIKGLIKIFMERLKSYNHHKIT